MWLKLDTDNHIMNFQEYSQDLEGFDVLNGLNTNNMDTDHSLINPVPFQLLV